MATEINYIKSSTHPLKIKKTATKATIELKDESVSLTQEFKVSLFLFFFWEKKKKEKKNLLYLLLQK